MIHTDVIFRTTDNELQALYNAVAEKETGNIKDFAGRKVLIEGGNYNGVWLETQPMSAWRRHMRGSK